MTALKISAIAGSMIIAAGGSAAIATRDKWWPENNSSKGPITPQNNQEGSRVTQTGKDVSQNETHGTANQKAIGASGEQCNSDGARTGTGCTPT